MYMKKWCNITKRKTNKSLNSFWMLCMYLIYTPDTPRSEFIVCSLFFGRSCQQQISRSESHCYYTDTVKHHSGFGNTSACMDTLQKQERSSRYLKVKYIKSILSCNTFCSNKHWDDFYLLQLPVLIVDLLELIR